MSPDTFSAFSTRLGLPLLFGLDSMDLHQKIYTNVEVAVPAALAPRLRRSVNRSTLQRALGLAELAVPKLEGGTNRRHRKGADRPPPSRCRERCSSPFTLALRMGCVPERLGTRSSINHESLHHRAKSGQH